MPRLACVAWATVRYRARLRRLPASSARLAAIGVARGLGATGLGLGYGIRRAWAPPLAVLARRRPRLRALLLAAFAVPVVQDALSAREPRAVPADAGLRLVAELVALAGTWEGCARARTLRPLLPSRQRPDAGPR